MLRRALVVATVLVLGLGQSCPAAPTGHSGSAVAAAEPKSVLFVFQEERALPGPAIFLDAISTMFAHSGIPVTAYTEDLDVSRFGGPEYESALRAWYRAKYQNLQPDVIVTSGLQALRFVLRYREELWPGAPVVFTGVAVEFFDSLALPSDVTGVTVRVDVEGTLDFALALLPDTRRVVFVGRTPAYSDDTGAHLRTAAARRGLEVLDLSDLPVTELKHRLADLPEDTIVYYRSIIVDKAGRVFQPALLVPQLSSATSRPIFGDVETYLGRGIVGGSIISPSIHGEEAGRMVLRILRGESVSAIPIMPSKSMLKAADWRELQRWHIDEARLPAGTEIRYRQAGLWEQYYIFIVGVLAVMGLQAALIVALLIERRQRVRAQLESRRRLQESAHLNRVAALGDLASSLAHELNQPLAAILTNAQAATRFLDAPSPDLNEVRETLSDIADDDRRAGAVIQRMRTLLKKGELTVEPLDLDEVVRDAARLVRTTARHRGAIIELDLDGRLPPIAGDAVQLEQVLLNLLVNGLDAMAEVPVNARRVVVRTARSNGRQVEVSVTDSGKGIRPDDLNRLFEPFFSTKSGGLGVGLAITRSIVQAHGGRIWAESEPQRGTTFHCVFPLAKERGR